MSLILSVVCLVMNIFLSGIERKKTKTLFTPFFCFSILYSIIMIYVAVLDLFKTDYQYKMSFYVPLVSIIFFILFFAVGYALFFSFGRKIIIKRKIRSRFYINKLVIVLIIALLLLLVLMYFLTFKKLLISTGEFKTFFSTGIQGHIVNVVTVLFLYIFASKRYLLMRIAAVFWTIVLALASAKYMMIVYALSLVMIFYYSRKRFSLLRLIVILLVIASLFIITYILRSVFDNEAIDFRFIFGHLNYYITGSYYAFSKVLTTTIASTENVGVGIVIAPIINIFKALSGNGDYVSSISQFIDVEINSTYNTTNVFTAFGAVLLETNMAVTIIFVVVLAIFSYLFLYYLKKRPSTNTVILYSLFTAFLFCTFFNCFYGTLNFVELFVIVIVLELLNRLCKNVVIGKKKARRRVIKGDERSLNYA